jgi:hypothetical protein
MKIKLLNIAFVLVAASSNVNSQISIGNIEEKKPVVQPQKIEIPVYDSLTDFSLQEIPRNYLQYIGCQFYMPPELKQQIATPDPTLYITQHLSKGYTIYDKYYTIISLANKVKLESPQTSDTLYVYKYNDFIQQASRVLKKLPCGQYFILHDNKSGDTLYWRPKVYESKFIFVPYFVKQKKLYEKKTFYYEGPSDDIKDLIDANHTIYIQPNSKWTCKEVTLLKYSQVSDYVPSDSYMICYIFTNEKNESFAKWHNPFYPEIRDPKGDYHLKYFISEKEFLDKEKAIMDKQQADQAKKNAQLQKEKLASKAKQDGYITKYGKLNADLIINGKVKLGFTKEMCLESWGPFFNPSKTVNNQGVFETWMYSVTQILHFKDGVLTQIEQ